MMHAKLPSRTQKLHNLMLRCSRHILTLCFAAALVVGCSTETKESSASAGNSLSGSSEQEQISSADSEPPQTDKPTFRSIPFGAEKAKIREWQESDPMTTGDDYLAYRGQVGGLNALWSYYFTSESQRFARAAYIFVEQHANENLYIDDYKNVQSILTDKYGSPTDGEGMIWRDDLYQDDPSEYGFAISIGDLIYQKIWETDSLKIFHTLEGDNYEVEHTVQYQYLPLSEALEKESRQAQQENF